MIKAIFYFDDNTVTVHSENTKLVTTKFQPGYYVVEQLERSIRIEQVEFKEIHEPFPNQKSSEVIDTVIKFLDSENRQVCREMGFLYKLNILMYGKQGVGKTALLNFIGDSLIKAYGAIVFRIDNKTLLDVSWGLAEEIRKIQDNPIVFIMDEVDQYCGRNTEAYMKSLLDGNRSIDNSIVLAATNYLDRIPETLKERPSRFRLVCEIKAIKNKDIIKSLIEGITSKAKTREIFSEDDIDKLVESLDHITIDQVKNIIIDRIMNITLDMPEKLGMGFKNKKEEELDIEQFKERMDRIHYKPIPKEGNATKLYNHKTTAVYSGPDPFADGEHAMSEG